MRCYLPVGRFSVHIIRLIPFSQCRDPGQTTPKHRADKGFQVDEFWEIRQHVLINRAAQTSILRTRVQHCQQIKKSLIVFHAQRSLEPGHDLSSLTRAIINDLLAVWCNLDKLAAAVFAIPGLSDKTFVAQGRGDTGQAWNCLLYTSPSPRDLSTSRMPSSA